MLRSSHYLTSLLRSVVLLEMPVHVSFICTDVSVCGSKWRSARLSTDSQPSTSCSRLDGGVAASYTSYRTSTNRSQLVTCSSLDGASWMSRPTSSAHPQLCACPEPDGGVPGELCSSYSESIVLAQLRTNNCVEGGCLGSALSCWTPHISSHDSTLKRVAGDTSIPTKRWPLSCGIAVPQIQAGLSNEQW